jgi:hypothetical protein
VQGHFAPRLAIARQLLQCYTPLVPKKKPSRKKPVAAKKKPAKVKKQASKKKPLRKKKRASGNGKAIGTPVVETFEVELVGSTAGLFDDDDESDEDFPQEYGGSE